MAVDDGVRAELRRFEIVEWLYDGLNGRIIPWTKEHGGTSDDPSAQAFVLHHDGTVIERAPDAEVHQKGAFAGWLKAQADAHERRYPPTRVPLVRAEVEREGETLRCPLLDAAREAGQPVLLYFGRTEREGQDRDHRREAKASRKFEKSTLDSKKAAEAAEGWALLRLDLAEPDGALFARTHGVEAAPALVLWAPEAEKSEILPPRITGATLAYRLKRP